MRFRYHGTLPTRESLRASARHRYEGAFACAESADSPKRPALTPPRSRPCATSWRIAGPTARASISTRKAASRSGTAASRSSTWRTATNPWFARQANTTRPSPPPRSCPTARRAARPSPCSRRAISPSCSTGKSTTTRTFAPNSRRRAGSSRRNPTRKCCSRAILHGAKACSTDCAACSRSPSGTARLASFSARAISSASNRFTTRSKTASSSSRPRSNASWSTPPTLASSIARHSSSTCASSSARCRRPSSRASSNLRPRTA